MSEFNDAVAKTDSIRNQIIANMNKATVITHPTEQERITRADYKFVKAVSDITGVGMGSAMPDSEGNRNAPQASSEPLLSIVTIYDAYNEKKWLKEFLANMPKVQAESAGMVQIVLCKNIGNQELEADELRLVGEGLLSNCSVLFIEYHYREFSFSAARNAAKSQAKGEWILSLDTDECLEQRQYSKLFEMIADAPKALGGIKVTMGSHVLDGNTYLREFAAAIRVFRNDENIRWQSRIHECVDYSIQYDNQYAVIDSPILINHLGYECDRDMLKLKYRRNMQMLCAEILEPENEFTAQHAEQYLINTCVELKKFQ